MRGATIWDQRRCVLAAMMLPLATACTLLMTLDEENRPCGPDSDMDGLGDCVDGFTCFVDTCVSNHSVTEADTCMATAHCVEGYACADFRCRPICDNAYAWDPNNCRNTEVCVPSTDPQKNSIAVCLKSDCTHSPCDGLGTTCVNFRADADAKWCMDGCTLSCPPGEICGDDCSAGPDGENRSCQPLGIDSYLVCVRSEDNGGADLSERCDFVRHPCRDGLACIDGQCAAYCEITDPDACNGIPGTSCVESDTSLFAICE